MKGLEEFGKELGDASIKYDDELITLKSGIKSHWYVNLRRGNSAGDRAIKTGDYMLQLVEKRGCTFDVVAGAGVDGKAVVTAILWATIDRPQSQHVTAQWINDDPKYPPRADEPKSGYGFDIPNTEGKRILTVDGTWTSGGSMKTLIDLAREAGGIVEDAAVEVDRSNGSSVEIAAEMGVRLHRLFVFNEQHHMLVPAPEL